MIARIQRLNSQKQAMLSLVLLIPLPLFGVLFGMIIFPNTIIGTLIFFACKVGLLAIPITWQGLINQQSFTGSPAKKGGDPRHGNTR